MNYRDELLNAVACQLSWRNANVEQMEERVLSLAVILEELDRLVEAESKLTAVYDQHRAYYAEQMIDRLCNRVTELHSYVLLGKVRPSYDKIQRVRRRRTQIDMMLKHGLWGNKLAPFDPYPKDP